MSRFLEKISLIGTDVIAVNAALYIVYLLSAGAPLEPDDFLLASLAMTGAWLVILPFFGVYRSKFAVSRTDELINIFKAVTFGTGAALFSVVDRSGGAEYHAENDDPLLLGVSCFYSRPRQDFLSGHINANGSSAVSGIGKRS